MKQVGYLLVFINRIFTTFLILWTEFINRGDWRWIDWLGTHFEVSKRWAGTPFFLLRFLWLNSLRLNFVLVFKLCSSFKISMCIKKSGISLMNVLCLFALFLMWYSTNNPMFSKREPEQLMIGLSGGIEPCGCDLWTFKLQ